MANMTKLISLIKYFLIFAIILSGAYFVLSSFGKPESKIEAQASTPLTGWAWSNVGWISLNDTNSPPTYGVNADTNGLLSGYAWSNQIGWIDFAPSGPYPNSPNNSAEVNLTTGVFSGWARACGVFESGCSGNLLGSSLSDQDSNGNEIRRGGWDGWIALSGGWSNGVKKDMGTGEVTGYAWGGDEMLGWIQFAGNLGGITPPQCTNPPCTSVNGLICNTVPGNLTVWTDPSSVSYLDLPETTIYWSSPNNVNFNSCTAQSNPNTSSWNGAVTLPPDSKLVQIPSPPSSSTSYTINCVTTQDTCFTATTGAQILPAVYTVLQCSYDVAAQELTWPVNNVQNCSVNGPAGTGPWTFTVSPSIISTLTDIIVSGVTQLPDTLDDPDSDPQPTTLNLSCTTLDNAQIISTPCTINPDGTTETGAITASPKFEEI